jgi:hypothetical protein
VPKKIIITESDLKKLIGNILTEQSKYVLIDPKGEIKAVGGFVFVNNTSTCVIIKKGDTMFAQGVSSISKNGDGSMTIKPNVGMVGSALGYNEIKIPKNDVIELFNTINSNKNWSTYKDGAKITLSHSTDWCKKNFK